MTRPVSTPRPLERAQSASDSAVPVLIAADEVGWHTRQLQGALRRRGRRGRCVDLADVALDTLGGTDGLRIPGWRARPPAVLVRGIAGGSFEQVTRRLAVLHLLDSLGVPLLNGPRAIERSVDKAMTSALLRAHGVPTPPAWAFESRAEAERCVAAEARRGHALVLKPLFGSQGKGIERVGRVEGRDRPLPSARRIHSLHGDVFYLQRWIAPAGQRPHDLRVLVIGGQARAAMRRYGSGWIHNVAQGARCEAAPLEPGWSSVAEAASAALGLGYAGVDLIEPAAGGPPQVLEVNGVAAWQGLQRVTPWPIADALVDHLLSMESHG